MVVEIILIIVLKPSFRIEIDLQLKQQIWGAPAPGHNWPIVSVSM